MSRIPTVYLDHSYFFDYNEPRIQDILAEAHLDGLAKKEQAIRLYTLVRDGWRYDPYTISWRDENYRASFIADRPAGNCVDKSILLIACLRAVGIPARLHLGRVKNHIAVERLTERFGSNELTPHGMVNLQLEGRWLKCSQAFNKDLCDRFQVDPLDFDGESDSFLQQFNREGTAFMEYTADYGHFADVPLEFMKENLVEHYPQIFGQNQDRSEYKL